MVRWEIKPHPCLTVQADLRPGPAKKPTGVRTRSKINCRISPNFLQFLQFFVMFSLSSLSLHKFEMESGISSGGASSPPDIRAEQESYNTGFFFGFLTGFWPRPGGSAKTIVKVTCRRRRQIFSAFLWSIFHLVPEWPTLLPHWGGGRQFFRQKFSIF